MTEPTIEDINLRATKLVWQVMKTWSPPKHHGHERPEDIAQTSVMLAVAYIMGTEFLPDKLSENQSAAIQSGLELMHKALEGAS